jgi:hypothetical protein
MSVELTHYLGIGYKLDYDSNIEKIEAFLDKHPFEYSEYRHLNPNADEPGLQIVIDGMNGNYIYLLYVLNKVEQDDLYSNGSGFSYCVADMVDCHETCAVCDLYKEVFGEYYDGDDAPCLVSFFHCT